MKILVTPTSLCKQPDAPALRRLRAFCPDLVFNDTGKPLEAEELTSRLAGCDGYLAGLDFITAAMLDACPDLKAISRYGAGVDRVDLGHAAKKGVLVSNTPGVNATAVAELAFGLILNLARRISFLDRDTRAGGWTRSTGMELGGKTLGILGLGAIGKLVARMAQGFSMRVLAYDPYLDEGYAKAHSIEPASLEELLRESDVLSLHLPLTDGTRHLIDAAALAAMKPGTLVVNASRGGIVDEEAAFDALVSGQLGGLGLDAFEQEPPGASRLLTLDNVVATPHTGAHTAEAIEKMADLAVDNLIAMLSTGSCPHLLR